MAALKIRFESLPARCEICHQLDRFDAETNYCSRCASAIVDLQEWPALCEPNASRRRDGRALWDGLAVGAITLALLISIWVAVVFMNNYLLTVVLLLLVLQLCRQ